VAALAALAALQVLQLACWLIVVDYMVVGRRPRPLLYRFSCISRLAAWQQPIEPLMEFSSFQLPREAVGKHPSLAQAQLTAAAPDPEHA